MDDKDFQAFCSELKKETPDMSVIMNGMEKYGTGALSDTQRAEFLKKMFPDKSINNKDRGFQNTTGIRNALTAMRQLQADDKIGNAQMRSFLTETNPKGGANVVTTLALNVKAAEMKLEAKDKGKPAIKDPEMRTALQQNLEAMGETLGILAEVDGAVLQDVLQTPDKTSKQGSFKDYAQKSAILTEFEAKAEENAAKQAEAKKNAPMAEAEAKVTTAESDSLTFEPLEKEEPIKMGGMENGENKTLNISAKPKDLNVNAKPNPEDEEEEEKKKVAKLQDSKNDSADGKSTFDFEPVKEQDIIQYMYNAWFLGGLNGAMKWLFKKADRGVDRLISRLDSLPSAGAVATQTPPAQSLPAPTQQPTTNTRNTPTALPQTHTETPPSIPDQYAFLRQLNGLVNNVSNQYLTGFHINELGTNAESQNYIRGLLVDIQNNINLKPEKWDAKVLVAARDAPFMERMGKIYDANPGEFAERMETLARDPSQLAPEYMTKLVKVSAHLAAVDYAAQNLGQPLEGNEAADKFVNKKTFEKMVDTQRAVQQLQTQAEIDYRREKGLAPDAPIPNKDHLKIEQKVGEEFGAFYEKLANDSMALEDLMNQHHLEQNPREKKRLEQDIKQKHQELTQLQGRYLPQKEDPLLEDKTSTKPAKDDKKMDIREAAQADIQGQKTEKQWMGAVETSRAQLNEAAAEHDKRQASFKRGKEEVLGSSSRMQQMGKIAKHSRKGKGDYE